MTDALTTTVAGRSRGTRPVRRPGAWRLLGTLLAAILLVAAPAVPAAEGAPEAGAGDAPAGWIEHFAGPSAEYLLTRGGQPLAVYPLMQVYPGDLISVRYPGGHLRLHLGETDTLDKMEGRIKHDLFYLQHWSIWMDIKIILLTPLATIQNKNAY